MPNLFQPPAGLLGDQEEAIRQQMQTQGLLGLAAGLFQAGTPSRTPQSLGGSALQGLMAGQQMAQGTFDTAVKAQALREQMAETRRKRAVAEQLRTLAPSLITTQRAPSTQEVIASEQGDDVLTRPGAVTGYGINMQALPALAALGPEGMEYASSLAKFQETVKPKTYTLKPGEQVVTETGEVKASVPAQPEKVDLGTHIAFIDPKNPTTIIGTIPKGKDTEKLTTTELAVGKNFTAEAAPYIGISQAYTKIEAAAKNKSPAGDLSLIFGYMKILDPGSVVREGEFATAQNTGSVPETISALYNRVLSGQRLTDTQRADFLSQAQNLVASQRNLFNTTIAPKYVSIIETNGLNARNVVYDPFQNLDLTKPLIPKPEEGKARSNKLQSILFPPRK